jgi:hypothetical protein
MKGLNIILLAIWLIVTGVVALLKLSYSWIPIIIAILQIAAGIFLIIGGKKDQIFSNIASIVLAIYLIAMGAISIFGISFNSMDIIMAIFAIVAGILIIITTKKGKLGKNLGGLLLAIYLILFGLIPVIVTINLSAWYIVMAILAIASGILLLLKK